MGSRSVVGRQPVPDTDRSGGSCIEDQFHSRLLFPSFLTSFAGVSIQDPGPKHTNSLGERAGSHLRLAGLEVCSC